MCKCLETGGDEFDNTVLTIIGHRPECTEFKIDKFSFAANIHAEAQKIADRIMQPERSRLKLLMETYEPKKVNKNQLSESNIQARMFSYLYKKGHRWIVPNFQAFSTGEMDVCSVMKSGLVNEYEIKISRSDFRADLKKEHKHPVFANIIQTGEMIDRRPSWNGKVFEYAITAPNFFYYVVPTDLVTIEDVPAYAGLIYVNPQNLYDFRLLKKAVKIHSEPISTEKQNKIAESLMWRFWNLKREQVEN